MSVSSSLTCVKYENSVAIFPSHALVFEVSVDTSRVTIIFSGIRYISDIFSYSLKLCSVCMQLLSNDPAIQPEKQNKMSNYSNVREYTPFNLFKMIEISFLCLKQLYVCDWICIQVRANPDRWDHLFTSFLGQSSQNDTAFSFGSRSKNISKPKSISGGREKKKYPPQAEQLHFSLSSVWKTPTSGFLLI